MNAQLSEFAPSPVSGPCGARVGVTVRVRLRVTVRVTVPGHTARGWVYTPHLDPTRK